MGTGPHPFGQEFDLRRRERMFGWHLEVGILPADPGDQSAAFGIPGFYHRPVLAAFRKSLCRIQPQATFLLVGSMAFHAAIQKQGTDLGFEEG